MLNMPNWLHDENLQSFVYLWRQQIVCLAYGHVLNYDTCQNVHKKVNFSFQRINLFHINVSFFFVSKIRSFASKVALIFCHSRSNSEIRPINAPLSFLVTRILAVMLLSKVLLLSCCFLLLLFLLLTCYMAQSAQSKWMWLIFSFLMLVWVDILSCVHI